MMCSFSRVVLDVRSCVCSHTRLVVLAFSSAGLTALSQTMVVYHWQGKPKAMPTEKGPFPIEEMATVIAMSCASCACIPNQLFDQKLTLNMSTNGLDIARPFS